ncbi:MAG: isochorismate synthase, partial [Pricia sp.]|nr:isochorismate synthase [Pricia sp.]
MDFFDKIDSHISDRLPVVVYRKPNEGSVKAILQKDDQLIQLNDYSETGFVFAPFDADHPVILLRNDEQIRFENYFSTNAKPSKHDVIEIQDDQKEFYIHLIEKAISTIKKDDFKKVVLSRRLKITWNTQPLEFFRKLLATYTNAFCYLWYHPKVGTWIGATPEILLTAQNRTLTTMSLAGTQTYSGNESPAWGNKELEEQELVTDFIMDALKDKVSNLNRTPTETIQAGNLM